MTPTALGCPVARSADRGRKRLMLLAGAFMAAYLAVAWRLFDLSILQYDPRPAGPSIIAAPEAGRRADIVDRNGVLLATSLEVSSAYADPADILDPVDAARKIHGVLPHLDWERLAGELGSDRRFVWIERHLSPVKQRALNALGIPGLNFRPEYRRIYPGGRAFSHLLGYTDIDNKGLAGMERGFQTQLSRDGAPLALSVDARVQYIVRSELDDAMQTFRAAGATGLVMDVRSGEFLAMVSLPDFDPNTPDPADTDAMFNRATLGVYEMGSTFKIFNTALALSSGKVRITDRFDAIKPVRVGRFTINDYHPENRWLSVAEIFEHSSNIGSVRMLQHVGFDAQQPFLKTLGLLDPSPLEMPEMGRPLLPSPWRDINAMTITYGHGLAINSVQLASAVSAIVNGGSLHPATILRRNAPAEGKRVLAPGVSDQMRGLFRLVVTEGTATSADSPGYIVGGKTGTADKKAGRGYDTRKRISSFIGAFPMHDPHYLVFVLLDEPKGTKETWGFATGGWVAAPSVGRIIGQIGPLLGIKPYRAEDPVVRSNLQVPAPSAQKLP